jgi:hypothetical protein
MVSYDVVSEKPVRRPTIDAGEELHRDHHGSNDGEDVQRVVRLFVLVHLHAEPQVEFENRN